MAEHVCACSCDCFCEGVERKPDLGCMKPCAAMLAAERQTQTEEAVRGWVDDSQVIPRRYTR